MLHCIIYFPSILLYVYTLCQTLNHFNILLHYYNVNDKSPKPLRTACILPDFTEIFVPGVAQPQYGYF